jgi:hypothetical protein
MKTKHTQGEWAFDDNEIYSESTDHGAAICTMNTTSAHFTQEEVKANARLIAAAPTMLNALIEAEKLINSIRQYMPKSVQNADRFNFENINANVIKAAIQKATQP